MDAKPGQLENGLNPG